MIAQRFRAIGWVAGIASAATCLYLTSLQVAAERAKLEEVELRIAAAQRDMLQLKTELSTRASFRQLERWNDEDLSMAAPSAAQYMRSETELASLSTDARPAAGGRPVPRAQLAAATMSTATASETLSPTPNDAPVPAPRLRNANYITTETTSAARAALIDRASLEDTAAAERRTKR